MNQIEIKDVFRYDPETGFLYWKEKGAGRRLDRPAGYNQTKKEPCRKNPKTYRMVEYKGRAYLAHRLIYVYVTGEQPNIIDHDDGDSLNNCFSNLTNGDHTINQRNRRMYKSKSGVFGVYWRKNDKSWASTIGFNGKHNYLGSYKQLWDAICARKSAEVDNPFHDAHGKNGVGIENLDKGVAC